MVETADVSDSTDVTICLLADYPDLIPCVGQMRWAEWGASDEPLEFWIDVTRRESGRNHIPISWVAIDAHGQAAGAVGIIEFDPDGFKDRSPWLVGMIVDPERRRLGIGARLVRELEDWAARKGFTRVWLATGPPDGPAEAFYRSCGWRNVDEFVTPSGDVAVVLERRLTPNSR